MHERELNIKIVGGWAPENQELALQFISGHRRVLEEYGILNVSTNNTEWIHSYNAFVICAVDEYDGAVVGGVRIEIKDDKWHLPVVHAIEDLDPAIHEVINSHGDETVAEICGLWNGRRVFGRGVSRVLSRAAVAFSSQLEISKLYCIVAQFTIEIAESLGFELLKSLGNDGYFPYPNDAFKACVLRINNVAELPFATDNEKKLINKIRSEGNFENNEVYHNKNIKIKYNLYQSVSSK